MVVALALISQPKQELNEKEKVCVCVCVFRKGVGAWSSVHYYMMTEQCLLVSYCLLEVSLLM